MEFTESEAIQTPTGLSVYAVTGWSVYLTWNAPGNVDAVHVERSTDGATWVAAGMAHGNGALDRTCEAATTYQYRVFSVVGDERSVYSDVVEATTAG